MELRDLISGLVRLTRWGRLRWHIESVGESEDETVTVLTPSESWVGRGDLQLVVRKNGRIGSSRHAQHILLYSHGIFTGEMTGTQTAAFEAALAGQSGRGMERVGAQLAAGVAKLPSEEPW